MLKLVTFILFFLITVGSFAQEQDTLTSKVSRQWVLSEDFTEEIAVPVDTMFSLFNRNKSADKYSPFNAYLGNYGLPLYQMNFFDRPTDPSMFVYNYYYPFMHIPGNATFLDTKVPFTELLWTFGAPKLTSEQTFRVRHSQNINRYLNIGVILDVIYSVGHYSNQLSDNKNFLFHSSYTRERYKAYFAAGLNNLNSYENGGVIEGQDLVTANSSSKTKNLGVNLVKDLNKSKSILKNKNILLVQRFTPGKNSGTTGETTDVSGEEGKSGFNGTFTHILSWENNKRNYIDNSPNSGFYDSVYFNNNLTNDSLYSRILKNTVRFDFRSGRSGKFQLGAGIGLKNEVEVFSQIIPTHDSLLTDTVNWNKNSTAIVGKIFNNIGKTFNWSVSGDLYFSGYREGDFNLNGEINKSFNLSQSLSSVKLFGGISNTQPAFWYNQWGSNNFEWKNNFLKELRLNTGARFSIPDRRLVLKFNFGVINNYVDFGYDALPSQEKNAFSVAALSAEKEFIVWKLHFANNILLQKSTNSTVLNLPLITLKSALFLEHNFFFKMTNGHLNTQIGADVFYNSQYYGYAYMPATGRYYRQNSFETGNYPYINVFLNIKLKRTRIVIMYDHVNSGMMGYDYFMVPSYPMNIRMFRYGLAWTFYD